ncbi:MAG: autotransporter adhesin family protein, partial [Planctomycetes bacterium]|nr:autotransporter adhesin family protein [Planctomycetota bacterium]
AQNGNLSAAGNVTSIDLSGAVGTYTLSADGGNLSLGPIVDSGSPTSVNLTAQGNVTLQGVDIENRLTVTADDDNNGANILRINGMVRTASDSITLTGSNAANETIDLNGDVIAGTSLTLQKAQEVDLGRNADLSALGGNLSIHSQITGIDLSGNGGTNTISADQGNIVLAPITDSGTPNLLRVSGERNVTLNGVDLENGFSATVDDDNNSNNTLFSNALIRTAAGSITLSGGGPGNDTINLDADVIAGGDLTIQNAGEVDLAQAVDLTTLNGNLSAAANVTNIDLSGAAGENLFTSTGGSLALGPLTDSGSPTAVRIDAGTDLTLGSVDVENLLDIAMDSDGAGSDLSAESLSAHTITMQGTGTDDAMTFTGTVTSTSGAVTLTNGGDAAFQGDLISASTVALSGQNLSLQGVTSSGNQTFTGVTTLNADHATQGGAFAVNGNTLVGGEVEVITSGSTAAFSGKINAKAGVSDSDLDIRTTSGKITFGDDIGDSRPLAGLHAMTTGDIAFTGTAATQRLCAGEVELGSDLSAIPTVATVYKNQPGDLDFDVTDLTMGLHHKLTVLGALNIDDNGGNASSVTVEDVNALGDITIRANQIAIRTRDDGLVLEPNGFLLPDQGVDMVSGGQVFFSTAVMPLGSGASPRVAETDGVVSGATNLIVETRTFELSTSDFVGPAGQILDLRPEGPSSTHTVGVVNGADPWLWTEEAPQPEDQLNTPMPEEDLLFDELLKFLCGQVWYSNQPDPDQAMPGSPLVDRILERYWGYFLEPLMVDSSDLATLEPGQTAMIFQLRHPQIRLAMEESMEGYFAWYGERRFDAPSFRAFLNTERGETFECVKTLREILTLTGRLPLRAGSLLRARRALLTSVTTEEFTYDRLEALLESYE